MKDIGTKSLLNVGEAAKLLGVSVHTLNQWRSQKRELPYVKLGERVLYDPHDIREYLSLKKIHPNDTN